MQLGRPMAREYRLKHAVEIPKGVTLDLPGIYEWAITYADGSIRRYVGKYTRRSRPTREYHANVERILDGRPYRRPPRMASARCTASWQRPPPRGARSSSRSSKMRRWTI